MSRPILVNPVKIRFLGSAGSKKGRIQKVLVSNFSYIYGSNWVLKEKKIGFYNKVRRAIFCYPSNLPYFDQKGVPLPPRGVRGGQLDYPWNQCQ